MIIKILGTGCRNCKKLEANTRKAVEELAIDAEIIKVTEYPDIASYNVMKTPGLVINEEVISSGKVNSVEEIMDFLKNV